MDSINESAGPRNDPDPQGVVRAVMWELQLMSVSAHTAIQCQTEQDLGSSDLNGDKRLKLQKTEM